MLRAVGPEEVSIDSLAERLELGRKGFDRRFAEDTGLLPSEWRREARVIEAARQMSLGLSVTDAVAPAGFRSRNALNEVFRAVLERPPKDVRAEFFGR